MRSCGRKPNPLSRKRKLKTRLTCQKDILNSKRTMLHRLCLQSRCNVLPQSPSSSIQCVRLTQKRFKHGRDFPRNIPPPAPPGGTPIFRTNTMTLHYDPPPSAPSYKSTPTAFLPETHPFVPAPSMSQPPGTQLPPPLNKRRPREKSYNLTQKELSQMRRLRSHPNPKKRKTRAELASMFGCSQLFVGMAAPLPKEKVKAVFKEREETREAWSPRKRYHRDMRLERRKEWYQGDE